MAVIAVTIASRSTLQHPMNWSRLVHFQHCQSHLVLCAWHGCIWRWRCIVCSTRYVTVLLLEKDCSSACIVAPTRRTCRHGNRYNAGRGHSSVSLNALNWTCDSQVPFCAARCCTHCIGLCRCCTPRCIQSTENSLHLKPFTVRPCFATPG